MVDVSPTADRIALLRPFSEFLIEFSIALHKYTMYPDSHPSLDPAVAAVVTRAAALLSDKSQIAFGVARRQLIIEGAATNPAQPVLRRLAEWLNRHQLGAVTVVRGLEVDELKQALRALAQEPEQSGPLGLAASEARSGWPHLRLHPLSFGGLSLVGEDAETPAPADRSGSSRSADLWLGLARAALANDGPGAASPETPLPTEPSVVARAIDEHPSAEAYDQVITGYLLQIARELRDSTGAETVALQRRIARLIGSLKPETLRRLMKMGGNVTQRHTFLLDVAQGMAADAVVDIVKVAGEVGGEVISQGLLRLLAKLAVHAEFGAPDVREVADGALREQVGRLLAKWRLKDPTPVDYSEALHHLAIRSAPVENTYHGGGTHLPDSLRLVQLCLECGEAGPFIERAIDRAVAEGHLGDLVGFVSSEPGALSPNLQPLLARLCRPEAVRLLLEQSRVDFDAVARLQPFMNVEQYHVMLDALAASKDRTTRRKLLDRLAEASIDLGPLVLARLGDERWFVERNLLVLLERRGRLPEGFSPARWTMHPDVRVRREAIYLQLRVPAEHHRAVRAALEDKHPRLMRSALESIQQECPGELVDLVGSIALDAEANDAMRVLAAHALGRCRDRRALPVLAQLIDGGRTLLGRRRLTTTRSPVVLAALEALAAGWSSEARAASLLRVAAQSDDPLVRRAVHGEAR